MTGTDVDRATLSGDRHERPVVAHRREHVTRVPAARGAAGDGADDLPVVGDLDGVALGIDLEQVGTALAALERDDEVGAVDDVVEQSQRQDGLDIDARDGFGDVEQDRLEGVERPGGGVLSPRLRPGDERRGSDGNGDDGAPHGPSSTWS
jgi:hypothetical protein